jgi:hypothetical protein
MPEFGMKTDLIPPYWGGGDKKEKWKRKGRKLNCQQVKVMLTVFRFTKANFGALSREGHNSKQWRKWLACQ